MNFWTLVAFAAIIFVIMYDPKSGKIEKYIERPVDAKARSNERSRPCEHYHYDAVQFGRSAFDCPQNTRAKMGAIIAA